MQDETFNRFHALIYDQSGIFLSAEKNNLLSNRIQRRLRELNLDRAEAYLEVIESDLSGSELMLLLDAISTNTTYFYREEKHFEIYQKVLQQFVTNGKKETKIWCAAASSGEEPFTLIFEAEKAIDLNRNPIRMLATDISTRVLKQATAAAYPYRAVAKLPPEIVEKFFVPMPSVGTEKMYRVKEEWTRYVTFKRLNLMETPYPLKGPIDIIFCRNVMIYFDQIGRQKVINQFAKLLSKGGYLFLSHSENLLGIDHPFRRYDTSVFVKD